MWLLLLLLVGAFGLSTLLGAPYLPTLRRQSQVALDLLGLERGQVVLDLGSGDGTFLLAAAKRGIRGIGYEINPVLYVISRLRLWRYRRLIKIHLGNYWHQPLPVIDGIYVFLIARYMDKLHKKLTQEIIKPVKVASFGFAIPNKQPLKEQAGVWLYQY